MELPSQAIITPKKPIKTKSSWFLLVITLLVIVNFVIDIFTSISALSVPLLILTTIEIAIIGLSIRALKGSNPAYIALLVFFFIRSFNFYFEDFSFWTKSGFELTITLNNLGINLIPTIITIGFMFHSFWKFGKRKAQNPIALLTALILLILILGIFADL